MIIVTWNGKYNASDEQARLARAAMVKGAGGICHLNDQDVTLKGDAIKEVIPGTLDEALPPGKWRCNNGHLHPVLDTFCGIGDLTKKVWLLEVEVGPEKERAKYSRQREIIAETRKNLENKLGWRVKQ